MSENYGHAVRDDWLLDKRITFLNHGSYGAVPRSVIEAQNAWRDKIERQPVYFFEQCFRRHLQEAAEDLAEFVGCNSDTLAFVTNSTEGINAAIESINLTPGDTLLSTDQAYKGVKNKLISICGVTGAKLVIAKIPRPVHSDDEIIEAVDGVLHPGIRLAVFDHISSRSSVLMPIKRLVNLCHAKNIPVLVDGAHAPGMVDLDIDALGADWYVGSCHKWLCAPKGCGLLSVTDKQKHNTRPNVVSTGYNEGFWEEFSWLGIRDPSAWLSVTAAIDFWKKLGVEGVRNYIQELANWAGDELVNRWGTERTAAALCTGAMVTVRVNSRWKEKLRTPEGLHDYLLRQHHIEVPVFLFSGELWVRVSTHVYNSEQDIDLLAQALS